ncbi:hypothetical protein UO65_3778 [Actinokineospora spheciospongiae]|uniref:Uncharacterized protein n=1 Tax=Actinokineospora spheciospongiae TaxID=909613 RepID=W7IKI9_9PSEU|nr:hypothetical protein UO65_3778 [Actinokineospora spheciospongiae]
MDHLAACGTAASPGCDVGGSTVREVADAVATTIDHSGIDR